MNHLNSNGASVTPTQHSIFKHGRSLSHHNTSDANSIRDLAPSQEVRSLANALAFGSRNASLAPSGPPPGSFSSELKNVNFARVGPGTPGTPGTPKLDTAGATNTDYFSRDPSLTSEQRQHQLRDKINKETKIKVGSENLLEALIVKNAKQTKDQRQRVENELTLTNRKISELNHLLEDEIERSKRPATPPRDRLSGIFQGSPLKTPDDGYPPALEGDQDSESPSLVLDGILQALENEGMQPDYYVEQANKLVDLFKRHPTLKHDLAWSIFGLRVQTMLLSDSREVVAAGYRVTRHAIADRKSLQTIRALNTDDLVILSLVKESKASIEREQALKFVRAFLDVKGGIAEVSNAILRTIVSIADHHEDRLRNMALLTLAEVLLQDSPKAVAAGTVSTLADALAEGSYLGLESLAAIFLQMEDKPQTRLYLQSGYELDGAFTAFTDPVLTHINEDRLKANARLISAILKTWPGLFAVTRRDFMAVRSLLKSLQYDIPVTRSLILDLLFDVLYITPPSWTSSYLAGRRLTTYGRVANFKADSTESHFKSELVEGESTQFNLVEHFKTLLLAILMHCGLIPTLTELAQNTVDGSMKRKMTLLLSEVLKLVDHSLPEEFARSLQALPELFSDALQGANTHLEEPLEESAAASSVIYQVDRVFRTIQRSNPSKTKGSTGTSGLGPRPTEQASNQSSDHPQAKLSADMDEIRFRAIVGETQVLTTSNYLKWRWDLINDLIEGPLTNPKRLEESIKASKFMKRLVGFYRPFKCKFSEIRNTKPNQRYVRVGCALVKALLQNTEGINYLAESKFLRQLAECLAQLDRQSGLTAMKPLFSQERVSDTLTGGYFTILGALTSDPQGLSILERWHMINMFYHILELDWRDDLIKGLLTNMDFSLDSHLRVMLSKALTACPKTIRIFATGLLRKYATNRPEAINRKAQRAEGCEWAIRLLVTQLYDPEVQVAEAAVQILEEVCNRIEQLEYVVRCRPALDHLGAIGAPLLLRFLSTSLGYRYLDGLDYITQEMDDWFLGRNDTYVTLVEASLSRALAAMPERPKSSGGDDQVRGREYGTVPPHFYRELTRTKEGCDLLRDSGHFEAFVDNIKNFWSEDSDPEIMLKVKGCLWAVGNIGAMELGAPFLEESDVVNHIIQIATSSEVMTMRGTAFFVLGLISRSLHGMEILAEFGWIGATDHFGRSLGYCLPPNLESLLHLQHDERATSLEALARGGRRPRASSESDPLHARILSIVTDLGNTVLTKKALGDLYAIKAKYPEQFKSITLFRKVMLALESFNFRLQVRRFVIDLFDRDIMRKIVLDEELGNDFTSRI